MLMASEPCKALMLKVEDRLLHSLEHFPQIPDADCLLVYGYVDHEQVHESKLVGTMLNEPNQDFGCHINELVTFSVRRMGDGKAVCVAELG